ncbi:MAG: hypothetical protein GY804_06370 [Alphaproteobacteria bacterium]|nr:hypothetical protein [Alphaproteobacteria bacterium]
MNEEQNKKSDNMKFNEWVEKNESVVNCLRNGSVAVSMGKRFGKKKCVEYQVGFKVANDVLGGRRGVKKAIRNLAKTVEEGHLVFESYGKQTGTIFFVTSSDEEEINDLAKFFYGLAPRAFKDYKLLR